VVKGIQKRALGKLNSVGRAQREGKGNIEHRTLEVEKPGVGGPISEVGMGKYSCTIGHDWARPEANAE